jgi:pimeloyl-ACP methyl ester carboxylesterase
MPACRPPVTHQMPKNGYRFCVHLPVLGRCSPFFLRYPRALALSLHLIALSFCLAEPLHAQLAFVEDNGPYKMLGPKVAAGAVIWSHGRSITEEDSKSPTPGYIETFRLERWDAFRFNRARSTDSLRAGAHALAWFAAILKARGYRTVVFAGQSYGAFMSLMAADISNDVNAVIAVAPAAFGPVGENAIMGALNASRLYPLLEHVRRANIMLFYFRDDIYDPGGRGPRSEQILSERQKAHLVVDQPIGLETHWAGSTKEFATRFGSCIAEFAKYGDGAAPVCQTAARGPTRSTKSLATLPLGARAMETAPLSGGSAPDPRRGASAPK